QPGPNRVLRRHQLKRRAPLEPLRGPTNHPSHRWIVVDHATLAIDDGDRLASVLHQGPEEAPQPLLGLAGNALIRHIHKHAVNKHLTRALILKKQGVIVYPAHATIRDNHPVLAALGTAGSQELGVLLDNLLAILLVHASQPGVVADLPFRKRIPDDLLEVVTGPNRRAVRLVNVEGGR